MSGKSDASSLNDEYETEELLVYVDLDTKLLDDQLSESNTKIKFLGIDTDRPIMQVNNKLFRGSYEYAMGTHVFLNESKKPGGSEDPCFQELPEKLYEYYAKTNKVLQMKRIFVEEKEIDRDGELDDGEIENLEHLRITKTYEEALNQFLKAGEQPPRQIVENTIDADDGEEQNGTDNEQDNEIATNDAIAGSSSAVADRNSDEEMEKEQDPDYNPKDDKVLLS